jgi:hypothetical protein
MPDGSRRRSRATSRARARPALRRCHQQAPRGGIGEPPTLSRTGAARPRYLDNAATSSPSWAAIAEVLASYDASLAVAPDAADTPAPTCWSRCAASRRRSRDIRRPICRRRLVCRSNRRPTRHHVRTLPVPLTHWALRRPFSAPAFQPRRRASPPNPRSVLTSLPPQLNSYKRLIGVLY